MQDREAINRIRRMQQTINEQLDAELKNKEQTSVTVGIKDGRVVLTFAGHPLGVSMTAEEAREIASLLGQGANELERKTDSELKKIMSVNYRGVYGLKEKELQMVTGNT